MIDEKLERLTVRPADNAVEQHSGVLRLSRPGDKRLARVAALSTSRGVAPSMFG